MWAIAGGVAKAYCLPFDYVLHDVSYTNVMMYCAVLPSYERDDDDKSTKRGKRERVINASDPKNRDEVHKIMFG